jgi:hypothetical protein
MADKLDKLNITREEFLSVVDVFTDGERKVESLLFNNINKNITDNVKKAMYAGLGAILLEMSTKSKEWLAETIPEVYKVGLNYADKVLHIKNKPIGEEHILAVNNIIQDASLRFDLGLDAVRKDFQTIIDQVAQQQIRSRLAVIGGESAKTIAKDIEKIIRDRGITGLTDKAGRKVNIEAYSRMVARTEISNAANQGVLNRSVQFGVDIVEVSWHSGVDPSDTPCQVNAGKIFSISGQSENYPKLLSDNIPPYHPNCLHILIPRPDLQ